MRSRLDRAEHAIEQERAATRDLQAALEAARQARPLLIIGCPKISEHSIYGPAAQSLRGDRVPDGRAWRDVHHTGEPATALACHAGCVCTEGQRCWEHG